MRKLTFLAAISVALVAVPATAHPEDEFGSSARRGMSTADSAMQAIDKLIAQKKLPPSWTGATLVSFDYRNKNGIDQYVLTYTNPAIKQAAKKKLYVLMSTSGEFISAGYKLT
jgi:hypothetical protein